MMNNRESGSTPVKTMEADKARKTSRLSEINTRGFWVNNKTGEGYRITDESIKSGHLKVIGYVSNNDQFSLVHSDPQAQVVTLREETTKLKLPVAF